MILRDSLVRHSDGRLGVARTPSCLGFVLVKWLDDPVIRRHDTMEIEVLPDDGSFDYVRQKDLEQREETSTLLEANSKRIRALIKKECAPPEEGIVIREPSPRKTNW